MKNLIPIIVLIFAAGCNNAAKKEEERKQDSIANAGEKKVDNIIRNDDSLIMEKEKELLKKYK